jgi:hypothetical protein
VAENRALLSELMKSAGSQGGDRLGEMVRQRLHDRDFLIAAAGRPELSADLLDTLASNADQGVALLALRNPSTRSETLARAYRTSIYPGYFSQSLAENPHTPPELIREIRRTDSLSGPALDYWFAANPATPRDILDEIARASTRVDVARMLLRNPAIDCGLVKQTAAGVARSASPKDDDIAPRIRELEAQLCR